MRARAGYPARARLLYKRACYINRARGRLHMLAGSPKRFVKKFLKSVLNGSAGIIYKVKKESRLTTRSFKISFLKEIKIYEKLFTEKKFLSPRPVL